MLSVRTAVTRVVVVVEEASWSRRSGIVGPLRRSSATQVIHLALLQQGVVLVAITAGRGSHATATARPEVILILLKVVGWIGGESGLGLGGESRVRDGVGQGAGAAEVHDIAEGHPSRQGKKKARVDSNVSAAINVTQKGPRTR